MSEFDRWGQAMKEAWAVMNRYRAEQALALELWPDCPVEGCPNKCCLALNSEFCFVHTPGNKHVNSMKIDARNYEPESEKEKAPASGENGGW